MDSQPYAMKLITIADNFSETPLGRYVTDGSYSGERFREEFLVPALKEGSLTVDIDGTEGYGSSFLEEAFGGLVRKKHFTELELKKNLHIRSNDPAFGSYERLIWKYISEEDARAR